LIEKIHRDLGHVGQARLKEYLKRNYKNKTNFEQLVAQVTEQCEHCMEYNAKLRKGKLGIYPAPEEPFHTISIDHVGPLPQTEKGNKYLLTVADYFTRFIVAVAVPARNVEVLLDALRTHVFAPFGAPSLLIADNAAEFCCEEMKQECSRYGIRISHTAPYHPQSNGLVERSNAKIIKCLRGCVNDLHNDWDVWLPDIMIKINGTWNETIQTTPHFALYKHEQRDALSNRIKPKLYNLDDRTTISELKVQLINENIRKNLGEATMARTNKENRTRKEEEGYLPGEKCFAKIRGMMDRGKLAPKYEPLTIVRRTGHQKYLCQTEDGADKEYHSDDIKRIREVRPVENTTRSDTTGTNSRTLRSAPANKKTFYQLA
jgi:transposase InsO family protein